MKKQAFFFGNSVTLENATQILTNDVKALDDLYTTYLEYYKYLDVDSLIEAQNAINKAIILINKAQGSKKFAFLGDLIQKVVKWKTDFDLKRDVKKFNAIIGDCTEIFELCTDNDDNISYQKASIQLNKAIRILTKFVMALNKVSSEAKSKGLI